MRNVMLTIIFCFSVFFTCPSYSDCPSADLTGDCVVDMEDLAALAGEWLTTGTPDSPELVYIPGGTFSMGDSFGEATSGELPVHTVTLSPFYMSKYEVTNGQFCDFLNSALSSGLIYVSEGIVYGAGNDKLYCETSLSNENSQINYYSRVSIEPPFNTIYGFNVRTKAGRNMSNDPVICVSWYGAVAYCNWKSEQENKLPCYYLPTWTRILDAKGYRLPTEAEWEYAARGGLAGKRFPYGDLIMHAYENYYSIQNPDYDISPTYGYNPIAYDGIESYTCPVGRLTPNGYGLYDMAGNVAEWCQDWASSYSAIPQTNPVGPAQGSYRISRGGTWYTTAEYCRISYRWYPLPDYCGPYFGFRVCLDF